MVLTVVVLRAEETSQSGWKLGMVSVEKVMAERRKKERIRILAK